jgi:hypothetical protein
LILCSLAAACVDNLEVPETNVTPVAVARVLDDERVMPSFMFSGAPLQLTLDASKSHDLDGTIARYRWLSATQLQDLAAPSGEDAGALEPGRWVPEGEPTDWPDDVEQPSVRLPAPGMYSFTLWVTDDGGRVSDPATLTITLEP